MTKVASRHMNSAAQQSQNVVPLSFLRERVAQQKAVIAQLLKRSGNGANSNGLSNRFGSNGGAFRSGKEYRRPSVESMGEHFRNNPEFYADKCADIIHANEQAAQIACDALIRMTVTGQASLNSRGLSEEQLGRLFSAVKKNPAGFADFCAVQVGKNKKEAQRVCNKLVRVGLEAMDKKSPFNADSRESQSDRQDWMRHIRTAPINNMPPSHQESEEHIPSATGMMLAMEGAVIALIPVLGVGEAAVLAAGGFALATQAMLMASPKGANGTSSLS
ncbi:hypothetical protein RGU70_04420 [Herbaspirillum sp. RTI4]|uniref:hypothetical protein n=1 Tax=Herbaspirillum sp. RTI4 TaxID=3048640 RepID=UPI002AB36E30|nr:hypothetical protein [Herbaspirillum sp. RTI4]MDY7577565.1 hypothetical protein [Herbaspirillum sp. RTI4]MEA9981040.1 hypothetical protein [Herbaspirillum sp. RTI4]